MKKTSLIQKLAWFYAANFLFIVVLSHWPGLTDAQGRLLGLFTIDPVDDIFHLLSGIWAVVAAWRSSRWSTTYFKLIGIPYGLDAITGLFFGREFLNLDIFTQGVGAPDFSTRNLAINLPHVLITFTALWIGFWLSRKLKNEPLVAA